MSRSGVFAIAAMMLLASQLPAQSAQVGIVLPAQNQLSSEPPSVRSASLITDGSTLDLLRNGFPARLHYTMERWSTGGWFDGIEAEAQWDVVVRYDAMGKAFHVYRVARGRTSLIGVFATVAEADAALGAPFQAPIAPPKRGQRSYYTLVLDIEALSLTELDELEQWLRGDLRPAVRGRKNAGTAVGRGVRTIVVRLLGGEKRRYEARSPTFRP